jgi:PhnB protein
MATAANPVPQARPTIIPNLVVREGAKAIEFYVRALGAREVMRMPAPDGRAIWHAELQIGDSVFYLNDEMPGMGAPVPTAERPAPVTLWVAAKDCDVAFQRAVDAGAKATMPPQDMFWGDRVSRVADPFGYVWSFATHQKDLTPEEMRKAGEEFARQMAQQGSPGR